MSYLDEYLGRDTKSSDGLKYMDIDLEDATVVIRYAAIAVGILAALFTVVIPAVIVAFKNIFCKDDASKVADVDSIIETCKELPVIGTLMSFGFGFLERFGETKQEGEGEHA